MIAYPLDPPGLDALLSRFRRYDDPRGFSEEYLAEPIGPNGLGILTRPLSAPAATAFVICRSPGPEQGPLQRLEAMIARALAQQGVASLRIRRGFGREGAGSDLDLGESCAEGEAAASTLAGLSGVDRIGTIGELLGASVALLTAARLELPLAVLVSPATSGRAYLRQLYRRHLIAGFMTPAERVARREPLDRQLEHGPVSVRGVRLTRESFAELAALDLAPIAAGFAGDALVIGVTRDGAPDAALRDLEPRATVSHARRPATRALRRAPPEEIERPEIRQQGDARRPGRSRPGARAPDRRMGGRPRVSSHPIFVPHGENQLSAVLTVPEGPALGVAILPLRTPQLGIAGNVFWALAAARLADRSVASVRFEHAGSGDSTGRLAGGVTAIDEPVRETIAVAELAMDAVGLPTFMTAGSCLGGAIALQAAKDAALSRSRLGQHGSGGAGRARADPTWRGGLAGRRRCPRPLRAFGGRSATTGFAGGSATSSAPKAARRRRSRPATPACSWSTTASSARKG